MMGITLRWDDEAHTVLYFEVDGEWTWKELSAVMKQSHRMMDEVDHTVHSLVDYTNGQLMPSTPLWRGSKMARNRHANMGVMVMIGAPGFLRTLFSLFTKLYPELNEKARFVSTLAEARALVSSEEAGA